jgi:hypothetical protein
VILRRSAVDAAAILKTLLASDLAPLVSTFIEDQAPLRKV